MPRVFVCYRREDSAGYTGRIYDRLVSRFGERQVFIDVDTIAPGDDFIEVIDSTIKSCDAVVAVIGRNWLPMVDDVGRSRIHDQHDFVRLELEAALARGVRIVPLLVGGGQLPKSEALPEGLQAILRRQALEIREPGFNDGVERLIKALASTPRMSGLSILFHVIRRYREATYRILRLRASKYFLGGVAALFVVAAAWHYVDVIAQSPRFGQSRSFLHDAFASKPATKSGESKRSESPKQIATESAPAPTPDNKSETTPKQAKKNSDVDLAKPGSVVLDSLPHGLAVQIDGQRVEGLTPLRVKLEPGEHTIAFLRNGHAVETQVRIRPGEISTITFRVE